MIQHLTNSSDNSLNGCLEGKKLTKFFSLRQAQIIGGAGGTNPNPPALRKKNANLVPTPPEVSISIGKKYNLDQTECIKNLTFLSDKILQIIIW